MSPITETPDLAPVVISAENISKRFVLRRDNSLKDRLLSFRKGRQHREAFVALDDVSINVHAGHTVALIGHNGSGKSTLLKVIGGILDPTQGTIAKRGRVAALLELGAGFHPDLSGRDNVFLNASLLGMSRVETEAVFDDIVSFAELHDFIDTQVKFYSSGMYVRLAFAVAIHTEPDILLVDEVLAVGDEAFQRKCMDTIRRFQSEGRTILLVTHNLNQVLELSDSAVLLHHGKLVFDGEPREAVAMFRDLLEEQRVENQIAHPEHDELGGELLPPSLTIVSRAYAADSDEPLAPGGTLIVEVEIDGAVDKEEWICAIQVDGAMGQSVLGTTTKRLDHQLNPFEGTCKLSFSFAGTQFGEGKYFVNVSVMDRFGKHLFDAPQSSSFNTQSPADSVGILYAPAKVSITQAG